MSSKAKTFDLRAEELDNDSPDSSERLSNRTKHGLRKSISDTRAMITKHDVAMQKKMSGLGPPLNSSAPRRLKRIKSFEAIREGWYPKPHSTKGKTLPRALFVGPQWVREAVSKEKIRLDTDDGYSLDLAYITKNIIAMGFPSSGINGLYRNHFKDVKSYLESRHPSKYRLWNLCIERRYDASIYDNRVEEFPFIDHNPPPLEYFFPFCVSVDKWLSKDKENVAVIHCKAGKGRTGVMITVYLMYKYHVTFEQGLSHYGRMRTKDLKGVTLPSQKRFIQYFGELYGFAKKVKKLDIPVKTAYLKAIRIMNPPKWMGNKKAKGLCIKIWDNYWRKPVSYKLKQCTRSQIDSKGKKIKLYEYILPGDGIAVTAEVKVEFYKYNTFAKKEEKFRLWFHASFLRDAKWNLGKQLEFVKPKGDKPDLKLKGVSHPAPIEVSEISERDSDLQQAFRWRSKTAEFDDMGSSKNLLKGVTLSTDDVVRTPDTASEEKTSEK